MATDLFQSLIARWFAERFGAPTEAQRLGWPAIAAGKHTLIAAPTGSGKTLAAFLVCIDQLWRDWQAGQLDDTTQVVYVSPLKALSNDIQRNLESPLAELNRLSETAGTPAPPLRAKVRTGDTPAGERAAMLKRPPHILVTTPESLYLLLTSERGRASLRNVRTVIVDEIHALARDKRGSHLMLSLERLEALCERPPVRVGLSATQRPMDEIARFLVGAARVAADGRPDCEIIDVGHLRELDLALEVPGSELSAVCAHEQWGEVYARLVELIQSHRNTLIFVNTRRMAERISHQLSELLGEDLVASHHGSLSKETRQSAERRLQAGELKVIVATASLEMGIDVGYIDLVCQIGSPRSIATFLQRVGRSGHALGKIPKGRLFPLTRDELIECLALVRCVRRGELDRIEMPEQPLDILAQQIVAEVAACEWGETELFECYRRAWPYRQLSREDFNAIVKLVSEGVAPGIKRGAYLHRDAVNQRLRARRGARIAASTSGGAIPEAALYRVIAEPETFVGTVDEHFAVDSSAGDVFLLGNTSWRVQFIRGSEVRVSDAEGASPSVPFWFGEAPGRTHELSQAVSRLREDLAEALVRDGQAPDWLRGECGASVWAAEQAAEYVSAQLKAIGFVPSARRIVFERFFDDSGGMQLVIHAPLGSRITRAWGLTLRKRFCRSFDFELQASADDDGIVLSLGPQHSFAIDALFSMLSPQNAETLLEQALLVAPMFQLRWRWNLTRSLAVLRQQGGQRVPPHLQRFRSDDVLAAVFPQTVGCLENHSGDVEIPDHPLVRQTMHDCKHEALDLPGFIAALGAYHSGETEFIGIDTREPSPFCYELINANPYAFLDGAGLEERRTRAVANRRTLDTPEMRNLATLDESAIREIREEAYPLVRSPDELHDTLLSFVVLAEQPEWQRFYQALERSGRATTIRRTGLPPMWVAAERWSAVVAALGEVIADPPLKLNESLLTPWSPSDARRELVAGHVQHSGPITAECLSQQLGLETEQVFAQLEALEATGMVLRGKFTPKNEKANDRSDSEQVEWCERRLLSRIHRRTMVTLRQQIQPCDPSQFWRFLARWQHVGEAAQGPESVRNVLGQLQGFELPGGAWERSVLALRLGEYDPLWLDLLFMSGDALWGRLQPPSRDEERSGMAGLTRSMPIALVLREDLGWLLPLQRESPLEFADATGHKIAEALAQHGALFFSDLVRATGLLPSQLEEGLRGLAALGLIRSDAFAPIRKIVEGKKSKNGRSKPTRAIHSAGVPIGRWSLFPGPVEPVAGDEQRQRWCRQLLARYGVLFRELLTRETAAPAWSELIPHLRRLELRGEIRGGRFVSGVGGEQYALPSAVDALRKVRDDAQVEEWFVISAADPLNLAGIITAGARIPATAANALVLRNGHVIATRVGKQCEYFEPLDAAAQWQMRLAMVRGVRKPQREKV